jgi:hypothetical protein
MTQQESIDYNTDLEQLLKLHAEECESLSILHRNSYEKYNGRSNYINIPVIILSSAIGFATGIDIGYANMNIILGVGSIFVGIIKSIDTYFQLGKRAESHRLCSLQFQQINKKIQIELALVRSQRVDAKDMMNIIKTDIKNLFDIAPLIDQDVIEAFQKKYGKQVANEPGKYTFDAHTPNLCNGLSIVTVNSARNKQDYEERSSRKSSRDGSPSRDNNNNNNNNNNDGNGITVVIDDATIANELQKQYQQQHHQHQQQHQLQQLQQPHNMFQLNQQLQQLQHLQNQVIIDTVPDNINNNNNNNDNNDNNDMYHASAELVSLHSTRASSVKPVSPPRSAPRSAPRSVSRIVPQSVPHSAPQSAPHSAPRSAPQSAPQSVPHSAPQSAPHSAPRSAPQSAPQSVPHSAPRSVPQSAPHSAPRSAPQSVPHSVPHSAPHSAPRSAPHSAPRSVTAVSPVQSVPISATQSAPISARQSVHGDSSPQLYLESNEAISETNAMSEVHDVMSVPDTATTLQLTQEQLTQLLALQQQMMQDLEGQEGEMM